MTAPARPAAEPQTEPAKPSPPPRWWEETPAEAARFDRMYWNEDE
ncbi:hypothetical protein [Streptomyces sp. NPDC056105]